jgi:hypothetical protein
MDIISPFVKAHMTKVLLCGCPKWPSFFYCVLILFGVNFWLNFNH